MIIPYKWNCGEGEEHGERYQYRGDLLAGGNSIMIRGNTAARSSSQEHQPSEGVVVHLCIYD